MEEDQDADHEDAAGNQADMEYLQQQMVIKNELDQLAVILKKKQEQFKIEAIAVDAQS